MIERVAALYDIHGNLPALEAVLEEVATLDVSRIVIGGDVVPGPMPAGVMSALAGLPIPWQGLRGNGDNDVLAALAGEAIDRVPPPVRDVVRWSGEALSTGDRERIAGWPETVELDVEGLGRVLFCHATPRSDAEIFTRLTPAERVRPCLEDVDAALVVCGHTHMPFDRPIDDVRVVNAGSVGMPFGEPGADWLLLGPSVELRRTRYDLEAAAARIRASDYPQAEGFAAKYVLDPPSEAAMLEMMEQGAMR